MRASSRSLLLCLFECPQLVIPHTGSTPPRAACSASFFFCAGFRSCTGALIFVLPLCTFACRTQVTQFRGGHTGNAQRSCWASLLRCLPWCHQRRTALATMAAEALTLAPLIPAATTTTTAFIHETEDEWEVRPPLCSTISTTGKFVTMGLAAATAKMATAKMATAKMATAKMATEATKAEPKRPAVGVAAVGPSDAHVLLDASGAGARLPRSLGGGDQNVLLRPRRVRAELVPKSG